MGDTFFPVNDLLRRKLPTGLAVSSLACSVASTLFLMLFSDRMGLGVISVSENVLTLGLSTVFSQFILFVGILIFLVGAVLTSFVVFLLMTQRTRDFGLIKASGCPNSLVFGYFMTELLILTFAGCVLGVIIGFGADLAVSRMSGIAVYQKPANVWFAPLVFTVFFILALAFGTKPILNSVRLPPMKAILNSHYFGLTMDNKLKPFSGSNLTTKIAMRNLSRRPSSAIRIVLLLSIVFILLTITIAGSIVAKDTTMSWVEKTAGNNVVIIAHEEMTAQYELLESKFLGAEVADGVFDYDNEKYAISNETIQLLRSMSEIEKTDNRLILREHVYEMSNFTIDPETLATLPVGDKREGDLLVIGVEPGDLTNSWFLQGRFFESGDLWEAVIGDSVARNMFSNPLVQSLRVGNQSFSIVGVCVDPVDNGRVVYVPLSRLQKRMGVPAPNIIFAELRSSVDRAAALKQIKERITTTNQELTVAELDKVVRRNLVFLDSSWSTVLLLPVFALTSATLCLIAFVILALNEQRHEFAIFRAVGARPKTIVRIVAIQNSIIMGASLAFGLSFGFITTLMILVPDPVVTIFTVLQIAAWLTAAATFMFLLCLAPAIKFARTPLLRIMIDG
ncbi:MAG TPA: FtsX-like permease family protein [Candidatus Bathyarchaeia archaeon]